MLVYQASFGMVRIQGGTKHLYQNKELQFLQARKLHSFHFVKQNLPKIVNLCPVT